MGLSRKHHGELNKSGVSRARFAELRQLYVDDPAALQQIDVYDPRSPYQPLFRKYRNALKSGDAGAEQALRELEDYYPDI